ncbi:IclR family transcriptional regulator [Mycolicibacterium sp. CBM1]
MTTSGGAARLDSRRDDRAAIDKAFSLLVAFGQCSERNLGVSELARRTSLSKSTAFRILGILERNEAVQRVGANYQLGARLCPVGGAAQSASQDRVRDLLMPFLAELFESTRQTVHLAVLTGPDVLYLGKLCGHRTVGASPHVGECLPAYRTVAGKVLLAYSPEAGAKATATPLHGPTPHLIGDADDVTADLSEIRRVGVAIDREQTRPGVNCVAAPVLGRDGRPWAALSVSMHVGCDLGAVTSTLRRICAAAAVTMQRDSAARYA